MKHIRKTVLALVLITVLLSSCQRTQSTDIRREGTVYCGETSMEYHIPESLYVETNRPLTDNELIAALDYPEYIDIVTPENIGSERLENISSKGCTSYISVHTTESTEFPEVILKKITNWIESNLETPAYIINRFDSHIFIDCSYELPQVPHPYVIPGTEFTRGILYFLIDIDKIEGKHDISFQIGEPSINIEIIDSNEILTYYENFDVAYYQKLSNSLENLLKEIK